MLTGFRDWDDEGSLMLSVKQYLSGMKIYEDVFSVYGPVYYYYNGLIRTLTGTPLNHDVTRLSALVPWILCCALSSWIVYRLTRSVVSAAATLFLVSRTLGFFHNEPGHPQEITIVLLVGVIACSCFNRAGGRLVATLAMGMLAGTLLWVKVNIGVFVALALGLALTGLMRSSGLWRFIKGAIGAICLLTPLMLMRNHLDSDWARIYCAIVTASVLALVVWIVGREATDILQLRHIVLAGAGLAGTILIVLTVVNVQGVSLRRMIDSLVLLPARVFAQNRNWYEAPSISGLWLIWVALGLGLAITAIRWPKSSPATATGFAVMKAAVTAVALGTMVLGLPILPAVAPFAWLSLVPNHNDDRDELSRTVLCSVAVIQTLYAYPVFGSQGDFIQVLLWIVVAVCGADALTFWTVRVDREGQSSRRHVLVRTALAAIVLCNLAIAANRYRNYVVLPALDLAGAHLMHVQTGQKVQLTAIAQGIELNCDAFESLPGLPSFNFWSQKYPVTGLNSDAWTLYLNPEQQRQIVDRLASVRRACVVSNPRLAAFWNKGGEDLDGLPLVKYIRQEFRPLLKAGDYTLSVRK
jgi:hypothetical protein